MSYVFKKGVFNMDEFLQSYTDRIRKYEVSNTQNYIYIGMNLSEIQSMNLLEGTNYKNIKDYALDEFGYESTKTYDLISVYKKFFEADYKAKRKFTFSSYSFSQLVKMLPMSDDEIKQCNCDMSYRDIRDIRLKKSVRTDSTTLGNTELSKIEIPGQNIISGVFPDKSDSEIEEKKQETIIVTALPDLHESKITVKPEPKIIVEVKQQPEPVYDFTVNDLDFTIQKYEITIESLKTERDKLYNENLKLKIDYENISNSSNEKSEIIKYFSERLQFLNINKAKELVSEINLYISENKLPEKLAFMKNVI